MFTRKGLTFMNSGDYQSAHTVFTETAKDVKNVDDPFYKAKTLFLLNEYEQVIPLLKEWLENMDAGQKPSLNLSYAYDLLGTCYEIKNIRNEAEKSYLKALELNPDNASALNKLGTFYKNTAAELVKDWNHCLHFFMESQKYLKAALELEPLNPVMLHAIASWYEQYLDRYMELVSIEIQVQNEDLIHQNFSLSFKYYTNAQHAAHDHTEIQSVITDNYADCMAKYGHFIYKKDIEKAIPIYLKTLQILPSHIPALNQLGNCYCKQAEILKNTDNASLYASARTCFSNILKFATDTEDKADAWLAIAFTYRKVQNWDETQACLSKAKELNPDDPYIAKEQQNLDEDMININRLNISLF